MQGWEVLAGAAGELLALYILLMFLLWQYARRNTDTVEMRDALRLLPDLLRLIHALAKGLP